MTLPELFNELNPPFDATLIVENNEGTRKIVFPHITVKLKATAVEYNEENETEHHT